jgi:hypothetical protein
VKTKLLVGVLLVLCFTLAGALYATAAPSTNPALSKRVAALERKVEALKTSQDIAVPWLRALLKENVRVLDSQLRSTRERAEDAYCTANQAWWYISSLRSALLAGDPPPDLGPRPACL